MSGPHDQRELEQLATDLGRLVLKGLGARSQWALRTTLDAASTEGITGVCILRIAAKEKDFTEVMFTVGSVDVTQRWDSPG